MDGHLQLVHCIAEYRRAAPLPSHYLLALVAVAAGVELLAGTHSTPGLSVPNIA